MTKKWDAVRHDEILYELAQRYRLPVTNELRQFYNAAVATTVYEIADDGPANHRKRIINGYAPPREK